ncbi:AAA family ATPase [Candidatus Woesearchaeota archaeon]|nr:AAA family ATPase [Candidatus Woesearchaeota archaeon]
MMDVKQKRGILKKISENKRLLMLIREKDQRRKSISKESASIKAEIGNINSKKKELEKTLEKMKGIEEAYSKLKQEFEDVQEGLNDMLLKKARAEGDLKGVESVIETLLRDIKNKEMFLKRLEHLSQMQQWLSGSFLRLMSLMEKHIMLQVYHSFNELFTHWFDLLIEDENINARLDDEFTPQVEQNGYEIDIGHMSGGEKTALALAYRLSLNKVINDLISTIKTKELLILDEPTDGFSSEQLDKIKDVLDELGISQVILVSHESKIESFVDNVIKVQKDEHVSSVA